MPGKSRLRRTISRWASAEEAEAHALRQTSVAGGAVTIGDAPDRTPVRLRGTLRTVTLRPRGGVPALEAELYDGTGVLMIIWLGRRRIAGIEPGRHIEVSGRIGSQEGHRVLFNPRYELL